jgi:hypothetical protein
MSLVTISYTTLYPQRENQKKTISEMWGQITLKFYQLHLKKIHIHINS